MAKPQCRLGRGNAMGNSCPAVKPEDKCKPMSRAQREVFGDGMVGRFSQVSRETWATFKPVFMFSEPKSRSPRSQSTRSSDETG